MKKAGEKIREQRKKLCFTRKELAKAAGINESAVKAYESGTIKMKPKTIEKIARTTNTNVSDWIDDDYFFKEVIKLPGKMVVNDSIVNEETSEKNFIQLITALLRCDNTMYTLYDALIDMGEITTMPKVELSKFSRQLLIAVIEIKIQKSVQAVYSSKDRR